MSRCFSLIVALLLIALSVMMVESASATVVPKPSVPEFTLRYVDNSYDEPPTYGTDPYTGKTVLTQAGYHVQNKSVELIIKNQPFNSFRNENGSLVWLFYRVAIKGHFVEWANKNWDSQSIYLKSYDSYPGGYIPSSENSDYTVMTFGLAGDNGTDTANKYRSPTYNTPPYFGYYNYALADISDEGKVDFRVQAIIGYSTRINTTSSGPPIGLDPGESYRYYIFTGQSSDWSSTQTITIPAYSSNQAPPTVSPSSSPTDSTLPDAETSDLLGLGWIGPAIVVLLSVIAVLLVFVVIFLRRRSVSVR